MDRRNFIINSTLFSAGIIMKPNQSSSEPIPVSITMPGLNKFPLIISTWNFGLEANRVAWDYLQAGKSSLDAVEQGIRHIESDHDNLSVGIGGLPDREGIVSLDACIMDSTGKAGSVTFLEEIVHPISVARLVMEKTPHVMLSGKGAQMFALDNGFERTNLLTDKSKAAWEDWRKTSHYRPVINVENHDTVGLLAMDVLGNISGGCSTSGLAYKMHGRVGDSPIIGAGLFVDNEIGAAVATGLGEMVMRNLSSFLVVELMRQGARPEDACMEAISRIAKQNPDSRDFQVGIISFNRAGEIGAFSLQKGFSYAIRSESMNSIIESPFYI